MNLEQELWTKEKGQEFLSYLETLKREEKIEWTRRIINTQMPLLALTSAQMKDIIKKIKKGNFKSFLDLKLNDYYEVSIINGGLIMALSDINEIKSYLSEYAVTVDNWSSCDCLDFSKAKTNPEFFYDMAVEFAHDPLPFKRRIGIRILFKYISNDEYINKIFDLLDTYSTETDYYVNMVNAWLVCECFSKRRNETLEYIKRNKLNKFTINKAIQKCKDSFIVSNEDKELLNKYKEK